MTASAMISPPPKSRFLRIRAGASVSPRSTATSRESRSPMAIAARAALSPLFAGPDRPLSE